MKLSEKLDGVAIPVSIAITAIQILILIIFWNVKSDALVTLGIVLLIAVALIAVVFEFLYMNVEVFRFVIKLICGGWKLGWNVGTIIPIPLANLLLGVLLGLTLAWMSIFVCVLAVAGAPIIPVIWYRNFA